MLLQNSLKWIDPLEVAGGISDDEKNWALFYSGFQQSFTGRYSILALRPYEEIISDDFSEFAKKLSSNGEKFNNAWFGYLGYGLKNTLEKLTEDSAATINTPNLWMTSYRLIMMFDHLKKTITTWAKDKSDLSYIPSPKHTPYEKPICDISSNMTKDEYLTKVSIIKEAIKRGDLYQANLTRKFFGTFEQDVSPFAMFCELAKVSSSPYSAYMKLGDTHIISSSPERFVHINEKGLADTRPIKGSAPRFSDESADNKSRQDLIHSEKDKAENLMIVDLMRNDFSRSSKNVYVRNLFDITSYATIHHMSSTIIGQKNDDISTLQFIKNCFPPGSMTGTPKIQAMELCSELEQQRRGIYSGAIGWFGGDGSVDLSVVIRTLIIQNNKFEFQVGGAIVTDSDPESEWLETLTKAKALTRILDIDYHLVKAI